MDTALLTLVVILGCLVLALLGLGVRRRIVQRAGGTFDCSLRMHESMPGAAPSAPSTVPVADTTATGTLVSDGGEPAGAAAVDDGKGWAFGVARYNGDLIEWFRVFSYAPRPKLVLRRDEIEIGRRRRPAGREEMALLAGSVVLVCRQRDRLLELALSEDALTGLLAWLESAPPGQKVNVA